MNILNGIKMYFMFVGAVALGIVTIAALTWYCGFVFRMFGLFGMG
jgi:hypothetical protein